MKLDPEEGCQYCVVYMVERATALRREPLAACLLSVCSETRLRRKVRQCSPTTKQTTHHPAACKGNWQALANQLTRVETHSRRPGLSSRYLAPASVYVFDGGKLVVSLVVTVLNFMIIIAVEQEAVVVFIVEDSREHIRNGYFKYKYVLVQATLYLCGCGCRVGSSRLLATARTGPSLLRTPGLSYRLPAEQKRHGNFQLDLRSQNHHQNHHPHPHPHPHHSTTPTSVHRSTTSENTSTHTLYILDDAMSFRGGGRGRGGFGGGGFGGGRGGGAF